MYRTILLFFAGILFIVISCEKEKPLPITITFEIANVSSHGLNDGAIDMTVEGGTSPFTILWSNGNSQEDLTDLAAGIYIVDITDSEGQNVKDTAVVTEPDILSFTFTKTNTTSSGGADGSIDITVTGGVEPYTFIWSNGNTSEDLSNLSADEYIVTVTDVNANSIFDTIIIADPINISSTITNASFPEGSDGMIEITVTGGIEPFTYLWNDEKTKPNRYALKAGVYSVTVTDAEMSQVTDEFVITEPEKLFETIEFESLDGLTVTADLYDQSDDLPVLLLCHMAGSSRGEYRKSAQIFYELGYNCMAIDQRSGGAKNNIENQTAKRAVAQNLGTEYVDAKPDIQAAVNYLYNKYQKQIIIIGSSYSTFVSFMVALECDSVSAIAEFSIYYSFLTSLGVDISKFTKPAFFTSENSLINSEVKPVYNAVSSTNKVLFIPSQEGAHGSDALSCGIAEEYWDALKAFLNSL